MKSFKEYLTESKKVYSFKVKVAGDLPENFLENLKSSLSGHDVVNLEEVTKTPVQKLPLDFPEVQNAEVTVFEVITEYPITAPELERMVTDLGITSSRFKIRGSGEPTEIRQIEMEVEEEEKQETALLNDSEYSETSEIDHKDYFGEENKSSFLQDLLKVQQERIKELEHDKLDADIYKQDYLKQDDKKSPVGS